MCINFAMKHQRQKMKTTKDILAEFDKQFPEIWSENFKKNKFGCYMNNSIKSFLESALTQQQKEFEKELDEKLIMQCKVARDMAKIEYINVALKIGDGIKERFRCGACDGAKCNHTLCCQAIADYQEKLKLIKYE